MAAYAAILAAHLFKGEAENTHYNNIISNKAAQYENTTLKY